ncbi:MULTISPECIES: glycosyltransferase 87 family protein [unclassified Saccharothrix]|uniref:glycosyltransferase 87 family protein n=1 Tax=unclassified Saccharothrix TaxID=2593673 RepID=UPI00307F48BE
MANGFRRGWGHPVGPWLLLGLAAVVAVRIGLSLDDTLPALPDARIYRAGVLTWWSGGDLYTTRLHGGGNPALFTYPPFALLPLSVLVVFPIGAALLTLGSVAALYHVLLLVVDRVRPDHPRRHLIAAVAVVCALQLEPVAQTVYWGQVNILLLWLVALDCLHRHPRWPRGVLVGLAAAVKLTPLVFVLFFLCRRRFEAAGWATGVFAAATAVGFAVAPGASVDYWTRAVWSADRVGEVSLPGNQSVRGMLVRLGVPSLWVVAVVVVLALAGWVVVRSPGVLPAWLATAAIGTLVSPMSWSHHWVWLAPLLVAAVLSARPALALPAAAAAVLAPHWVFPAAPGSPWWTHVLGESYTLVAVCMLVVLAWRVRPGEPGVQPPGFGSGLDKAVFSIAPMRQVSPSRLRLTVRRWV